MREIVEIDCPRCGKKMTREHLQIIPPRFCGKICRRRWHASVSQKKYPRRKK